MAMTKKEQAEMDRLRNDLALARAMRWPGYSKPAPMTRAEIDANLVDGGVRYAGVRSKVARGWFYNACLGGYPTTSATYGCSSGIYHSREGDVPNTQNMGRMFATKADALRALRVDLTEQCAKVLAAVDRQIEEAEAE